MIASLCSAMQVGAGASQQVEDPYANEPKRHPALVVRSKHPFNAETPVDVLATSPTTPSELFYVRNHLPVPHVDPATWMVRHREHLSPSPGSQGAPTGLLVWEWLSCIAVPHLSVHS